MHRQTFRRLSCVVTVGIATALGVWMLWPSLSPSITIVPTIENTVSRRALRQTAGSLATETRNSITTVAVNARLDSSGSELLNDCEFYLAVLITKPKGIDAAVDRVHRAVFGHGVSAAKDVESRIVAVDGRTGTTWVFAPDDARGFARLLAAKRVSVRTETDVRRLWRLLRTLRMSGPDAGVHRRIAPDCWELVMVGGESGECVLVVRTDEMAIVSDMVIEWRARSQSGGEAKRQAD